MYQIEVVINNEIGLHARPANLFVRKARTYLSNITLVKDKKEYSGKSIVGVLSMGAVQGTKFTIIAEGVDEKAAIEDLKLLIDSNFGE